MATDATPKSPARVVAVAVVLTVAPGFALLALLGSLRTYPANLPGFWSYPSGTIGDALILPALIAALVVQAKSLSSSTAPHERQWTIAAGLLGLVGGALVPLSWLADSHARLNWTLPRVHHFDLAGWLHMGYLSLTTGAIAILSTLVIRRLRAAPRIGSPSAPAGLRPTAMVFTVGAGLGMLLLIGRDTVLGGRTTASATTVAALLVASALFLGAVRWALGWAALKAQWRAGLIIFGFLLGLTGLIIGWPPRHPLLIVFAAVSAALCAVAATSAMESISIRHSLRLPTVVAITALLTGGLERSADALANGERRPLSWLVIGAAASAALVSVVGRQRTRRVVGYGLFLAY